MTSFLYIQKMQGTFYFANDLKLIFMDFVKGTSIDVGLREEASL